MVAEADISNTLCLIIKNVSPVTKELDLLDLLDTYNLIKLKWSLYDNGRSPPKNFMIFWDLYKPPLTIGLCLSLSF